MGSIPPAGTTSLPVSILREIDTGALVRQHTHLVSTTSSSPSLLPDLVFVNPSSGGRRAADFLPCLKAFAFRANWFVEFRTTASAQDLVAQAQSAATRGHSRFLVLGGDGSFQDLVNALANFPNVVLGILPAGGGNDLADSLGLPHHPLRAAELLHTGIICSMDVVRLKTSDGKERLYTGGGGVGLDAEAALIASTKFRNLTGRFRYLLSGVYALVGHKPIDVRFTMDSPEGNSAFMESKALLLAVLNTPSYGAGLRFAPQARTNDGVLDLVLVEDMPLSEILIALPRLILSGEVRSPRVKRSIVRRVKIETGVPCQFHGDGEILGYTPVEIEIVPRAIRVLCPPDSPLRS